jgi:hypothetical protein
MNPDFILPDGTEIKTGLIVKPHKLSFPTFESLGLPDMTEEEMKRAIEQLIRARVLFPSNKWSKNQKQHNSCNGYAGVMGLERCRFFRGLEHIELSGESLYSMINDGEDQGSGLPQGMHAMQSKGVMTAATCPYGQIYMDSRGQNPERQRFRAAECVRVSTEKELIIGLIHRFMAIVAVHVTQRFYSMDRYGMAGGANGPGNHAIVLDDVVYDTQAGIFKFDNQGSWGTNIHENGRVYQGWRNNLAQCTGHGFYLIRYSLDDEQADNPPLAV